MRYLGVDYGSKKIGLAISDEESQFAFPFSIITNKNKDESIKNILEILKEKDIQNIVVGESKNLKGEDNIILSEAKDFVKKLASEFSKIKNVDLEINFEKEWLSTLEARRYNDRRDADDSAAAIILQRFLDKLNRK